MIFLESWSRHELNNNFILATLASWLIFINLYCTPDQFRNFVNENWIGSPPLATNDPLLLHDAWNGLIC